MLIKGFDENLCCRGIQFEIGKTYDTGCTENLELCTNKVFHFCKNLENVDKFYSVRAEKNNRFCEIKVLGELVEDELKCGSNKIKILREITGEELNNLRGLKNGNTGYFNTGYRNTGDCNTGNWNTGDCNTGDWNTGNRNTGDCNTGYRNTGDYNTGDCNTGNHNTGDCNTGYRNTGYWNSCNYSVGLFNTKEKTVTIFNKDSGLAWEEIAEKDWYLVIIRNKLKLTEWIWYTEEEMKDSPIRQAVKGHLKQYTFKEACQNWWNGMSNKDKELIKGMPNFDADIFKEITGIEVQE